VIKIDPAAPTTSRRTGFLLRLLSIVLFTMMAVCVRIAAREAAVGQIVFFRSIIALVPLTVYLALRGEITNGLRTQHLKLHFSRAIIGGVALSLSFAGYAFLPLTIAMALSFLTPILTVIFAVAIAGERLKPSTCIAVVLGLAGVGMILYPAVAESKTTEFVLAGVVCGIGAAIFAAIAFSMIRRLTALDSPATIAIYFSVFVAAFSLATSMLGWPAVSGETIVLLIFSGFLGGCGHIAMTEAFVRVQASDLSACDYTALLWTLIFDTFVIGAAPDAQTLIGAVLILLAAMFAARQRSQR
jgi:drug/metabolite transporter (DMT)-like permease